MKRVAIRQMITIDMLGLIMSLWLLSLGTKVVAPQADDLLDILLLNIIVVIIQ